MSKKHALLAPSAAKRWMGCPGSVALTKDLPRTSSVYADEGTKAHEYCELYVRAWLPDLFGANTAEGETQLLKLHLDEPTEMAEAVKAYFREIKDVLDKAKNVIVTRLEVPLDISPLTGEDGAHGTADCLILADGVLHVIDFKYGKGVRVDAFENEQLTIYGLAAYDGLDPLLLAWVNKIRLLIVQPRIGNFSDYTIDIRDIPTIRDRIQKSAALALSQAVQYDTVHELKELTLVPSEGACRFCGVKADCPAIKAQVNDLIEQEFEVLDPEEKAKPPQLRTDDESLARILERLPWIRGWCDAVEAEAFKRLQNGTSLPGFKLVAGRAGNRAWDKENLEQVEKQLRAALPVRRVYEKKLISPTSAKKLADKGEISPRRWKALERLITRSAAKPTVVPETDSRPALICQSVETQFEILENDS